jgi:hypothetical protein
LATNADYGKYKSTDQYYSSRSTTTSGGSSTRTTYNSDGTSSTQTNSWGDKKLNFDAKKMQPKSKTTTTTTKSADGTTTTKTTTTRTSSTYTAGGKTKTTYSYSDGSKRTQSSQWSSSSGKDAYKFGSDQAKGKDYKDPYGLSGAYSNSGGSNPYFKQTATKTGDFKVNTDQYDKVGSKNQYGN